MIPWTKKVFVAFQKIQDRFDYGLGLKQVEYSSVCTVRMRKRAPRDFNGRTEVWKDGSVAVRRMESSPRIAEWDGPSRLPYYTTHVYCMASRRVKARPG